jgi:hypothetical protein
MGGKEKELRISVASGYISLERKKYQKYCEEY